MVVAAFNQEKALVGAFSGITNLRMELFEALVFRDLIALTPSPCRAALARRICRIEDKDEPFNTFSSDHGPRGCAKLEGVFSLDANRGTWIRPTVDKFALLWGEAQLWLPYICL